MLHQQKTEKKREKLKERDQHLFSLVSRRIQLLETFQFSLRSQTSSVFHTCHYYEKMMMTEKRKERKSQREEKETFLVSLLLCNSSEGIKGIKFKMQQRMTTATTIDITSKRNQALTTEFESIHFILKVHQQETQENNSHSSLIKRMQRNKEIHSVLPFLFLTCIALI